MPAPALRAAQRERSVPPPHQWGEGLGEGPEKPAQLIGPQPEIVVPEQSLIRAGALVGDAAAVLPGQRHVALQRRREHREVVGRPRRLPLLLTVRGAPGELGSELVRYAPSPLPVPPREPDDVGLEPLELGPVELVQPFAELLVARAFVVHPGDRGDLLRACPGTVGGHHHQLVPAEQHLHAFEVGQLAGPLAELLKSGHAGRGYAEHPAPSPTVSETPVGRRHRARRAAC